MDTVKVNLEGRVTTVSKEKYIKAKTKDLKDFGYTNLTEKDVTDQLEKVLNKENLSVIGMFIEKDIVQK